MKKSLIVLIAVFSSLGAFAHEGHDLTPGAVQAPNGGIMEPFKALYIEKVVEGKNVKLFPVSHEGKLVSLNEAKIEASYKLPKGKKQPLKLVEASDHYVATVDAKGAYKYELELTVKYQGKSEKKAIQIEPQP